MPEINPTPMKYDPLPGDLYLDSFRQHFYTGRVGDVKQTLQYLCSAHGVVRQIQGEILFSTASAEPPIVRDLRYADPTHRRDLGDPFGGSKVELWDISE
jgi:hypothetical protein